MIALLKIAVVLALLVMLLLVIGVAMVVRWVRKLVKSATDAPNCPPCRVNPEPEPSPQWRTPGKVQQFANEFQALGFEEIGAFTIREMQGLQMLAFVHPGERLYGIIYDHKKIPPSFDMACKFDEQTGLTASSSKMGRTLDKRPGNPILWVGDERVAVVLEALKKEPQPPVRLPVSAEGFLPHFKRAYAEGMNWRMKKGGVSRDEIRRQAESKGKHLDEAAIDQVYERMRKAHVVELQRGCLAQYLDEQQMPAAEWERLRARAVAIPETLETDELIAALEGVLTLDQEQRHALRQLRRHTGQTALDTVDEILGGDVGGLGLEKLGEVSEPVRAYVLVAPVSAHEETGKALVACS
jgi:hypothetical protein